MATDNNANSESAEKSWSVSTGSGEGKSTLNNSQTHLESGTSSPPHTPKEDTESPSHAPPPEDERPGARAGLSPAQFWIVILGLNLGVFMVALDFNIVATATPMISSDLGGYNLSSWLGTGYLITFTTFLPIYAKAGDIFGRRNAFLVATAIFILGSGLCGGSKSMNMLIWSRVIQGIGGAGVYGLTNVIVTGLVPLRQVAKYLLLSMAVVQTIANVAGPILGGAFAQYVTWRWIFWINLCISPVSLFVSLFFLKLPHPASATSMLKRLQTFDWLGVTLLLGGTISLLLGISWGGNTFAWSDSRVIGTLVAGPVMIGLLVTWEFFAKEPLLSPSFFRNRTVLAMLAAEFFFGANTLGLIYYVPQYFQLVFNYDAVLAGIGLLPLRMGLLCTYPIAAIITSKLGWTLPSALAGLVLEIVGLGLMTRWGPHTTVAEAIVEILIVGFGQGPMLAGLLQTAQAAVDRPLVGIATGLVIFVQFIGSVFGIAIFAAIYVNELRTKLEGLGLDMTQITTVLTDATRVHKDFSPQQAQNIVDVYAVSLKGGWWFMFACGCATLLCCGASKHWRIASKTQ